MAAPPGPSDLSMHPAQNENIQQILVAETEAIVNELHGLREAGPSFQALCTLGDRVHAIADRAQAVSVMPS